VAETTCNRGLVSGLSGRGIGGYRVGARRPRV